MVSSAASPAVPAGTALGPSSPLARWPRAVDLAVVAIALLVNMVFADGADDDVVFRSVTDVPPPAIALYATASLTLLWRRHRPLVVLAITLALSATSIALGYGGVAAVIFAVYAVGRYTTDVVPSVVGLVGGQILATIDALVNRESLPTVGFGAFVVFIVWYVGRRLQYREHRVAQLAQEHAAEARRVVTEERSRIARELHDVVAHRVSLMTVQAGAAKTVAAADPDGARRAMAAVEQTGREALDELRHLLGILRPDADAAALTPQPGLADVPHLVEQFADAGLDVALQVDAAPEQLPARVDLFTYRIVQEALTNVLRHAGADARAEVGVRRHGQAVTIAIRDDGRGAAAPSSGARHGIVGMRERALLLGGTLQAAPRPEGGFEVIARLPIREERP